MRAQPIVTLGASHAPEMTSASTTAPESGRARWFLLSSAVLVVAIALRLWKLGDYEPNDDEFIYMAGFDDAFAHPPLYAWILSLLRPLTHNLALLRLPSVIIGLAGMLWLAFPFAARRDWSTSTWVLAWCAVSLHHIRLSQTIKGFVLLFLVVAASQVLLMKVLERPSLRLAAAYCLVTAAAMWADYIGIAIVLADLGLLLWKRRFGLAMALAALCFMAALPLLSWVLDGIRIISEQAVIPWETLMGHAGKIFFGINNQEVFLAGTALVLVVALRRAPEASRILIYKMAVCWGVLAFFYLNHLHIWGRHLTLILPLWGLLLGTTVARLPAAVRWGALGVYAVLQLQYWPAYVRQTPVPLEEESWYAHQRPERTYLFGRWIGATNPSGPIAVVHTGQGLSATGFELGLAAAQAGSHPQHAGLPRVLSVIDGQDAVLPPETSHVFVAQPIPMSRLQQLGLPSRCRQQEGPPWLPPSQSWWECRGQTSP